MKRKEEPAQYTIFRAINNNTNEMQLVYGCTTCPAQQAAYGAQDYSTVCHQHSAASDQLYSTTHPAPDPPSSVAARLSNRRSIGNLPGTSSRPTQCIFSR